MVVNYTFCALFHLVQLITHERFAPEASNMVGRLITHERFAPEASNLVGR